MPIKLTYFDFGGRAEPARLAFHYGGVEFEDFRFKREEWPALKATLPFGQVPVLEVDGKVLTQSNAITRFAGKKSGLYPSDPWAAAKVDEVIDASGDMSSILGASFKEQDEAKKLAMRAELMAGPIPEFLTKFSKLVEGNGGPHACGAELTIADFSIYAMNQFLSSGMVDGIPKDILDGYPVLKGVVEKVDADPKIQAYYKK